MSNKQPLGQPTVVSNQYGFQLYVTQYNNRTYIDAKPGKLVPSKKTPGEILVIAEFNNHGADDFMKAARAAKKALAKANADQFQSQVAAAQTASSQPVTWTE